MARVAAIGHGTREELPADEALAIAARTAPEALRASIGDDALPAPGARVGIRPDDYATAAIEGVLAQVDRDDIAILRADATLGEVMVHFPRVGYTLREL